MPTNDNFPSAEGALPHSSDAHGRAALLLAESLIHGLCEKSILSTREATEIAERAVDIELEQAEAADGAGAPMWRAHALLLSIAASLKIEGDGIPTPPRLIS